MSAKSLIQENDPLTFNIMPSANLRHYVCCIVGSIPTLHQVEIYALKRLTEYILSAWICFLGNGVCRSPTTKHRQSNGSFCNLQAHCYRGNDIFVASSLFAEKQKDHLNTKVVGEFVNHISQNDSVSLGQQKVSVVLKKRRQHQTVHSDFCR